MCKCSGLFIVLNRVFLTKPRDDSVLVSSKSDLFWIVEDITAQLSIQELIEVRHEPLCLHGPLSWGIHSF